MATKSLRRKYSKRKKTLKSNFGKNTNLCIICKRDLYPIYKCRNCIFNACQACINSIISTQGHNYCPVCNQTFNGYRITKTPEWVKRESREGEKRSFR